ncbi:hypothetical protein J5N97_021804 [Dioscorea zingiberensis]|uniref:Uncharacterized protein n=1 Tax=Dioscorea zingiberensis TaxID=325984 RepID=A0A9D5HA78_9LILI|nr:hypothetical protein J5N97_021804 [Dioscorea zingiberensis]
MDGRLAYGRPLVVRLASEKSLVEASNQLNPSCDGKKQSVAGSTSGLMNKSAKIAAIKNKLKSLEGEGVGVKRLRVKDNLTSSHEDVSSEKYHDTSVEGVRLCIHNVRLFQKSSGFGPGHVPEYTVTISSVGHRPVSEVHVSCGDFSSARIINPNVFRRLMPGDCLVKNGSIIDMAEAVSFTYTNFPPYKLIVSAAQCLGNI